jgi:hypothetical protein
MPEITHLYPQLCDPISIEQWHEEVEFLEMKHPQDWDMIDNDLFTCQYGYIKLGFLLTKIRNTCGWKYCRDKFSSFKNWCQSRIKLSVWQVNQYIEAAEIARYLNTHSSGLLPKNLSQCLALKKAYDAEVGYYEERPKLIEAWTQITEQYPAHQITAGKIHAIADPDWVNSQISKVDRATTARAARQAAKRGMTLNEYLAELMDQEEYEESFVPDPNPEPQSPEIIEVMDNLDRKFQAITQSVVSIPSKIIFDNALDRLDELMNSLIGQFIPPTKGVARE